MLKVTGKAARKIHLHELARRAALTPEQVRRLGAALADLLTEGREVIVPHLGTLEGWAARRLAARCIWAGDARRKVYRAAGVRLRPARRLRARLKAQGAPGGSVSLGGPENANGEGSTALGAGPATRPSLSR